MSQVRPEQALHLDRSAAVERQSAEKRRTRRVHVPEFVAYLIIPLLTFILIAGVGTAIHAFQYDTDEGLNLMKAALMVRGYSLYSQIWSDQPPLYTFALASVFRVTGDNAHAARLLTAAFSALLILSLYDIVRRTSTRQAAAVATVLMLTSSWYLRLSFSVMIGLPALALAMGSLAVLARAAQRWGARGSQPLLWASAVLMSAAIATKVWAALIIIPAALLLGVLLARASASRGKIVAAIFVWLLAIGACCIAMIWILHLPIALVVTHTNAARLHSAGSINAQKLMRRDSDLLLLTLVGCWLMFSAMSLRKRVAIVPLVWFFVAAVVLQFHEPVWYHHSLLLSIPAVWIAALVIVDLFEFRARQPSIARSGFNKRNLATLLLAALIVCQTVKFGKSLQRMVVPTTSRDKQLVKEMRRRAPQTQWVVADRLMYPFAAGLVVPPELAVISTKRRETGNLPDELVVRVLREYRPEQLLLARIDFGPSVMREVQQHYRRIVPIEPEHPASGLYVRKELLSPQPASRPVE